MTKHILAVFNLFLFSCPLAFATHYVCNTHYSNGFQYDHQSKEWIPAQFTTKTTYYLQQNNKELPSKDTWAWRLVGSEKPIAVCKESFNSVGYISCEGIGDLSSGVFEMSNETMRIHLKVTGGYMVYRPYIGTERETLLNSFISIGTCGIGN